jgi:cytochrome c biogenesis factor
MDGDYIIPIIGQFLLIIAIISSTNQIFRFQNAGNKLFRSIALFAQISPFIFLVFAVISDFSSLKLVTEYGGADLPLLYRISAVWGGRAGPLLLFAALLSIVTWLMTEKDTLDYDVRIMHGFTLGILVISWFLDPFADSAGVIPSELNPLLQTDLMVIHPPVVFFYYALCIATAAVAMGGVISGKSAKDIHESQLHWARAGFLAGTVGIGLGGLWAYTVLDWGGYWAWDPVETGSILPWFALLLIIHARSTHDSSTSIKISPALGLISGALAIHATLVTRANGVWASVHAFAADGLGTDSQDPYVRILYIIDSSSIGFELASYMFAIVLLGIIAVYFLVKQQIDTLHLEDKKTFFETQKQFSILLIIVICAISIWIESTAVGVLATSIMILLITTDSKEPSLPWIFSGVILMFYASWSSSATIPQAIAGMSPFLVIWLLSDDDDDFESLLLPLKNKSARMKFARAITWYGTAAYLLLTWLLLTVEIDGTNLEAHEFYGAPFIGLLAIGLSMYTWGKSVDMKTGNSLLSLVFIFSILLGVFADEFDLPGDPSLLFASSFSRGAVSLFLLSWLMFAIPPNARQLYITLANVAPKLKKDGFLNRKNSSRLRLLGSHLSHFGILLLLVGHVFTTTLIDRSDPSHLVTLSKDQPVQHDGYEFTFTEVELISLESEDYDYPVGDGYLGVVIEMRKNGELIDTLHPGILRFDSPSGQVTPRSEPDRHVGLFGDTIIILDIFQSNDLLNAMMFRETSEVDRIRVTVHDLQGSHAVWFGWILIILGGGLAFASSPKISRQNTN